MALIEVQDLRYRYPGRDTLALDHVSFSIGKGEVVGLVGANLSGKSTLCSALVGLVPHFYKGAYGGRVTVAGMNVREHTVAEISRTVGLVFQNPFTQITGAKLTVYDEVAFGLEHAGVARSDMRRMIDAALDLLGLTDVADRPPFALSGGQMQRLAIASVLAMEPEILLLDEPTSQLDPAGTSEVFRAVDRLRDQGITVVIAEHKVERIAATADRVLALSEGKLVADGPPEQVFARQDAAIHGIAVPSAVEIALRLEVKDERGEVPCTVEAVAAALSRRDAEPFDPSSDRGAPRG